MVRSTIRPSSAIQRRCHAPQPNNTATTTTLHHRLIRADIGSGNRGSSGGRRLTGGTGSGGEGGEAGSADAGGPSVRNGARRSAGVASAEDDRGTDRSDPRDCKELQHSISQGDVFGFTGDAAVD